MTAAHAALAVTDDEHRGTGPVEHVVAVQARDLAPRAAPRTPPEYSMARTG